MLMGSTITVAYDPSIMQENDLRGSAVFRMNQIRIAPDSPCYKMTTEYQERTFIHELLHFIFEKLKRNDLRDDEKLIDTMADLLYQSIITSKGSLSKTSE